MIFATGDVPPLSDLDRLVHDLRHALATVVAAAEAADTAAGSVHNCSNGSLVAVRDAALMAVRVAERFLPGVYEQEEVCVPHLVVERFASMFSVSLGGKYQVVADVVETGAVSVSRSVVESALLNICVNAVAAMSPGGMLTVGCRPCVFAAHRGACVEVFVADTGRGLSSERFSAALDGRTRRGRASGVGLASTVASLRAVEADLTWVSRLGFGTEMCVHLPLEVSCQRVVPEFGRVEHFCSTSPTEVGVARPVVAVVDDDEVLLSYMGTILCDAGVETFTFSTFAAVADSGCVPDVAIVDAHVGEVDGRAVAELFHPSRATAVVFMSGDAAWLSRAGASCDVLAKPFSKLSLLNAVQRALLRERLALFAFSVVVVWHVVMVADAVFVKVV